MNIRGIEIMTNVKVSEMKTSIRYRPDGYDLFVIEIDGVEKLAARGARARLLADYAHGAGAKEVAFDFDLRNM